ncbi:MAG: hypothetical protein COV34_02060 [Candidatus Zambryskibacteria bacterium CG10_big_fil_rev_8_21_14_0_10_42_12]|uniref:DUF350 domain-containing protein n=1 Tax=Candidatus Zambryskibacteria bacterium CG10_big_fil_rev_8_21_14_0_10_42_12 TaxID=1975115 RepID=A0A2H0QVQ9_9BACT|nr:MAG: hypothetical protein COV34_02060 [Candidatus Zambryskibacteria bacterium CG10_big_fil_rev_8_21_14_0_10_42_12]
MLTILENPNLILSIASLSEVIGAILIAFVVYSVHQHIVKERKIDEDVLTSMKTERVYMVAGILLIIFSFILEVWTRLVLGGAVV